MTTTYTITRKPIVHVSCGTNKCNGTLTLQRLSRLEEGLGHEGFMCDTCHRRVKYVPSKGSRP